MSNILCQIDKGFENLLQLQAVVEDYDVFDEANITDLNEITFKLESVVLLLENFIQKEYIYMDGGLEDYPDPYEDPYFSGDI